MDELDVIETFIHEIESIGYSAITSGSIEDYDGDEVVIDDWTVNRDRRATNTYQKIARDEKGAAIGEQHKYYYNMRLDVRVFSEIEQTAIEILTDIKKHFRDFESNPQNFHDDSFLFEVGDGGGKREPLYEPTPLRLHQMVQPFELSYSDTSVIETADELTNISNNFNIL